MSKKPVSDTTIHVDRSVRPDYPYWMKKVMHELEVTGPAEYSITGVKRWLHEGQKNGGRVKGRIIYDYLESHDMLKGCLGLRDLEEIQKKGVAFFRKHFKGKFVYGWKAVAWNRVGNLYVPCLCENGDEVVVGWNCLDNDWGVNNPALRFACKQ